MQHPKNNPILKWAKDVDRHVSKEDTIGQQTHAKLVNITHHQGNGNQN